MPDEPKPITKEGRAVAPFDVRVHSAWRAWLSALATDPEAAVAAALTYQALDDEARSLWLDALEQDAPKVPVPKVAIYGPLLWVESDPERRARIVAAAFADAAGDAAPKVECTLRGVACNGDRVVALVLPLYLDFVQVLSCRYTAGDGFVWVRHEPVLRRSEAPRHGSELDATPLELTPPHPIIEELAHAIVAHKRTGQPLPEALHDFAHLFDPTFLEAG